MLTLFRCLQALKFGGGPLALRKNTLDYLIAEQGVLYFGCVNVSTYIQRLYGSQATTDRSLVSAFTVGATVLNFVSLALL